MGLGVGLAHQQRLVLVAQVEQLAHHPARGLVRVSVRVRPW